MTRRYRILFVAACPFPYARGTPLRILRTAEALAQRGHEVHVAAYHLGDDVALPGITLHRTPVVPTYHQLAPGPSYQKLLVMDALLARRVAQVAHQIDAEVIHAHHYEGLLAALFAKTRRPILYDAHTLLAGELPYYPLGMPRRIVRRLGQWLDNTLPRRADHVVAVTAGLAQQLIDHAHVHAARVSVVPTGIELDHFQRPPRPLLPPDGVYRLAYSGNLAPYQGIDLMLHAMGQALVHQPNLRLHIMGQGSFAPYASLVQALQVGSQVEVVASDFAHLPDHLAVADVALNPRPVSVGLPQKLLNYMAAGKPIVSFAASAPGLVHGETGWLVENGDVASFAQGILRLLADPILAQQLGRNAQKMAAATYSWEAGAQQLEAIYAALLARRIKG